MRTRVKVCGISSPADAAAAIDGGADALGFIFAPSPRRIALTDAKRIVDKLPPFVTAFAVVAGASADELAAIRAALPHAVFQFHGDEPVETLAPYAPYVKAFAVAPDDDAPIATPPLPAGAMPLFDSRVAGRSGGTGVAFDWNRLRRYGEHGRRFIVSGGLRPETVGTCVRIARPYAVDVRSGVETNDMKDQAKVAAFVAAVREADAA